jgi:DNA-binding transcriptional LysR family regulator
LAQIQTFERIARLGSFRAAGQQIGLTQPSISQRMRELEDAIGARLFVRHGPKISITTEGTALLTYADRMLETAREMSERFRTQNPLNGVLRLGINETFGLICLPELLRQLEGRYPVLKTSLHIGDTPAVSRLLREQQLDIAVISEPDSDLEKAEDFHCEPVGTNVLGWFVSGKAENPRGVLTPGDLCGYHLIITPPPARTYATAMRWFSKAGVVPQRLSMCNNLSVMIPTVVSGLAIGLIPARVMEDRVVNGQVRRLDAAPPIGHRVSICYRINDFGPNITQIVQLIRELVLRYTLFV